MSYWCPVTNTNVNYPYDIKGNQVLPPQFQLQSQPHQTVYDNQGYNLQQVPYETGYLNDQLMNYQTQDNTGFYSDNVSAYPSPCDGPQPWDYGYCYGFYGEAPCPYLNVVDMEDFM